MRLLPNTPKQSLSKAFLKQRPLRNEIDLFKQEFITLLDHIDSHETEEFHKNLVSDFLKKALYHENYFINTKGRQDLVVRNGKDNNSPVGVIIEAKRPGNKTDWISADKPNGKALHELILYYLRERIEENNIDIKYLVATNINEWYIIEAKYFENLFYKNKAFVKQYEDWRDGRKVTKDTSLFYNEIVKPYITQLSEEIPCTYFNIQDYVKVIKNKDKEDDKNLIALLKILSPQHLLKIPFTNDTNELDEKFYKELLHIIGLEEAKEGGKNIIRRKVANRNSASLLEMAYKKLRTKGTHKITDIRSFGETTDSQLFNLSLELCITWINRILFLKLLEGQLISYHQGDRSYRFLNTDTIFDFDELFKLFHNVLAVNYKEREDEIKDKYKLVPYLNSSLFEISDLEDLTICIDSLDNSESLEYINTTILKDQKNKNKKLHTLNYLFQFLDSYDFASEGSENIQEDNKLLINASVLGKVFEKINGYKDGSIYTPGFITMSMCHQSIRSAVLEKFKEVKKWEINNFEEIYNHIDDIDEANKIINDVKICDPAVGSGHFLVSALNEIISIKSELKILKDKKGKRLKEYTIEVDTDELFVTDENGEIFEYNPKNKESQRIQETLFLEKQTIIENCLFGVDVNPNSVKICRLRLWIELLKNAYYKEETNNTELETLPNIDINIKCGNSLLSRFPLDADLSKALKSIKYSIEEYRGFVSDYKNEKNRDVKKGLQKIIDGIKNDFRTEINKNDPKEVKLRNLNGQLFKLINQGDLFELDSKQKKARKEKEKGLELAIKKLSKKIDDIKTNAIFKNAFEWRFEFPEILNNEGEFEGFDLIIGNPPYISAMELKKSIPELIYKQMKIDFETAKGTVDLFIYFFEKGLKLIKNNAPLSFITPNRYLSASYGEALREYLFKNSKIIEIVDYSHVRVFKEASTYPIVTSLKKEEINESIYNISVGKYNELKDIVDFKIVTSEKLNFLEGFIWGYLLNEKIDITEKVINQSVPIVQSAKINATSTASEADEFHESINEKKGYKLINTGTIDRYESLWGKSELTDKGSRYTTPYLNTESEQISKNRHLLYSSPKIILAKIAIRAEAFLDSNGEYASVNTNCFHSFSPDFKPEYILAWLNSKLFQYTFDCFFEGLKMQGGYLLYSAPNISKMFIKDIGLKAQKPFISLVDKILDAKLKGKDSSLFEQEIDELFYTEFSLSKKERITIENSIR